MFKYSLVAFSLFISLFSTSCIEDGYTYNPSDQPEFSTDTLKLGTVFTESGTPTHKFMVYNRHDKNLCISHISLRNGEESMFRVNVDGRAGDSFENVDIRPNDSIYVLVDALIAENGALTPIEINEMLDFTANGRTQSVVLNAFGQDVDRKYALVLTEDTQFNAERPYQIYDSLVVAKGATLTLDAGTTLYFHDAAQLRVHGTLISNGSVDSPVNMTGDRLGQVVGRIPYELMSGQWGGVRFFDSSRANVLDNTSIRNTAWGVIVDSVGIETSSPVLTLLNCQLRNSAASVLQVNHASLKAIGCEFAEAADDVVYLNGGRHILNHCTLANYYLFSAIYGSMLHIGDESTVADVANSIIYGNGSTVYPGDLTDYPGVVINTCLLKPAGEDDANFVNILWDSDPKFYTIREDYYFDYRLHDESPAIASADPSLTMPEAMVDRQGLMRGETPDLGAYVYMPETSEE